MKRISDKPVEIVRQSLCALHSRHLRADQKVNPSYERVGGDVIIIRAIMNDRLVLVEGIVIGAVLAASTVYLLTRYSDKWLGVSNKKGKTKESKKKTTRHRPPSRCQSPTVWSTSRGPSFADNCLRLSGTGFNEEQALTKTHSYQNTPDQHAPVRSSSAFSVTPKIRMRHRDAGTDDDPATRPMMRFPELTESGLQSDAAQELPSDVPTVPIKLQHSYSRIPMLADSAKMRRKSLQINPERCNFQKSKSEARRVHSHRGEPDATDDLDIEGEYCRVITPENAMSEESEDVCHKILDCLQLRRKWLFQIAEKRTPGKRSDLKDAVHPSAIPDYDPFAYRPLPCSDREFVLSEGIFRVVDPDSNNPIIFPLPGDAATFFTDLQRLMKLATTASVKSFCYQRLMLLEQKFNLHVMMNSDTEAMAQKRAPHRDFYNVRKVDTHVHHASCMHQKHLLRFIKSKLRKDPNEVVIFRDGKYLTLKEVFESLQLTSYDLNVDMLDMHADKNIFHRFDKFNLKYNPFGQSRLREIFIKQENLIHGRFLAELTKQVFEDLQNSKYQNAEYRISIYGSRQVEWDILSSWICKNKLASDNVMWLIQIPRLYSIYHENGVLSDFEEMLDNVFRPLFEVTQDPASHPHLHVFLQQVVAFDTVDDESRSERRVSPTTCPPNEWKTEQNPPYAYYLYYLYANLFVLNKFRESRGLNTFAFRPHCGEAGDLDHLACGFMLCENISHGINLRRILPMQYLYYLAQIGLCMSPLSNNSLFLDYHKNPFPLFFARGLSVSLSTDDPLQIHLTREPLVEEYSIAAQVWKLSSTDLCEIARNSVLHSGFPDECKKHWVGERFWVSGPEGNDIHQTNVPNLRLRFRADTFGDEMQMLRTGYHQYRARHERSDSDEIADTTTSNDCTSRSHN